MINFIIFLCYLITLHHISQLCTLKVKFPSQLGAFRHIARVGSLYKLVHKVLATILGLVMDKVIFPNQLVLLKSRILIDGVVAVAVNEVIDLDKTSRKSRLSYKVDF